MWRPALIGLGLITALLSAATIGVARPKGIVAMNAQAAPASTVSADTDRAVARGSDGLFYVVAHGPSGKARLLVDTGASHVILSQSDASRLGARRLGDQHSTITTAAGTINADWVVIGRLEISGHTLTDVRAAVPRNEIQTSLLGQNALAQFAEVRIQGDQLTLIR